MIAVSDRHHNGDNGNDVCEEHIRVSLVFGSDYHFRGLRGRDAEDGTERWAVPPGDYRLLCVAKNVITGQDLVVYQTKNGRKSFACTLTDWHNNFTAPQLAEVLMAVMPPKNLLGQHRPKPEEGRA